MKIVMPGGRGHVGHAVRRHLEPLGIRFTILTRIARAPHEFAWNGKTLGPWVEAIEGADVVLNLAGQSVNCRYTPANLEEIMRSRVDSTRVIGQAIAQASNPPKLWLQASTATIYAHRFDEANDEVTGIIGGNEPNAPAKWIESIRVAQAWEEELANAATPSTRKVALRSAMTMSVDHGSVFDTLSGLARKGLGGASGNGKQYMSWIHEADFAAALLFLIQHAELDGPVNISSPNPLTNRDFMCILRETLGVRIGPPVPTWALKLGSALMGTESELILKSRRVVPKRLLDAGFTFRFPEWAEACRDLVDTVAR